MSRSRNRDRTRGYARASNLFPQGLSIFDVTVSSQRGCVFTADRYTVDGTSGKTASLVDWIDSAHAVEQGTSGAQCAVPAADSTLNGAYSLTFAGAQRYISNRAAGLFRYLHTGPFFELAIFVSGSSDRFVWSTINFASVTGKAGALSFHGPTSISRRGYNNGSVVLSGTGTTPFTSGAAGSLAMSYLEGGGTPEWSLRTNGAALATGDSSGAPQAVDPDSTLYVGGHAGGTLYYTGRLAFLGLMPAVPSSDQILLLSRYCLEHFGVGA